MKISLWLLGVTVAVLAAFAILSLAPDRFPEQFLGQWECTGRGELWKHTEISRWERVDEVEMRVLLEVLSIDLYMNADTSRVGADVRIILEPEAVAALDVPLSAMRCEVTHWSSGGDYFRLANFYSDDSVPGPPITRILEFEIERVGNRLVVTHGQVSSSATEPKTGAVTRESLWFTSTPLRRPSV